VRGGAQQVTPLFLAAMQNHPAVAAALLDHRADPNTRGKAAIGDDVVEARPLHLAAWAGGTRLVHALLAHRAVLDAKTSSGETALDYARPQRQLRDGPGARGVQALRRHQGRGRSAICSSRSRPAIPRWWRSCSTRIRRS
jgi:hypothetical protein